MKKIKELLLAGYSIALLAGCTGDATFKSIEICEFPKTTFYAGEDFSNTGISLKVTLNNGDTFITEDVTTSRPTNMLTPGTQTIKAYYTNDKYDIDTYLTYDIKVIDWSREEKAIFGQTSISSYAGIYYPKMEGMKLLTETDDTDGSVIDYWIELPNATAKDVDTYVEMLNNYHATKRVSDSSGSYDLTFKFYQQSSVPTDFRDYYGTEVYDAISFRYSASYEYMDPTYYQTYNLYGNEAEDTVVVGLSKEGKMIVRFIANSVYLETMFSCEVNEHLTFDNLYNGTALSYLRKSILGYTDEEGKRYLGALEKIAPLAKDYFIIPDYECEVIGLANYASMYPWLHGEDDFCFEVEIDASDRDEYDAFIAALDAKTDFTKTTKQDKLKTYDVDVTVYTIEDKDYVGDLIIEVTDYVENGMSYYTYNDAGSKVAITTDCYRVYYRYQHPEKISPCVDEVYRIYESLYGEGDYSSLYDVYEDGEIGGMVKFDQFKQTEKHPTKDELEVENKEEALELFVSKCLAGYTVKEAPATKQINNYSLWAAKYENENYIVTCYAYYYSSGKFAVEFSVAMK